MVFRAAQLAPLISVLMALATSVVCCSLGLSPTVLSASIISAILWAALPVTLILLAIDAIRQEKSGTGMRMLRLTASYTFISALAQLFLTVALVGTVLGSQALQGLVTGAGPIGTLLQGLSPILTMAALSKLAKKMNVSGMMDPRSAAQFGALGGLALASDNVRSASKRRRPGFPEGSRTALRSSV